MIAPPLSTITALVRRRFPSFWTLCGAVGAVVLLGLLGFPLASLLFRIPLSELLDRLKTPFVIEALRLSLVTSAISTGGVLVCGLPLALWLARRQFPGKRVLETIINLPMVLPPTVAGLALLLAFGRTSLLGRIFAIAGVNIPFTALAVMLAQMFVAAPFFINTVRAGFEALDPKYLQAAATLRATPTFAFFRVVLPLSVHSMVAGVAMSWARAVGEFGATITFAGNMPGRTQTMPLAVYMALQTDLESAVALAVILLAISFGLLLSIRLTSRTSIK